MSRLRCACYDRERKSGQKTDTEQRLDRKSFYQHPDIRPISKQLKVCGIIMYILAILNFWQYLVINFIAIAFAELILLAGLGIGIHLKQSRVCAIAVMIVGVMNMILWLVYTGSIINSGWTFLLTGAYAFGATLTFHKAWKIYRSTGIVPTEKELWK